MDAAIETCWQFSNRVYRNADIARTCLRLQDEFNADVNLLLFVCWYGHRHGVIPASLLARAITAAQPWQQNVVHPLRQIRRWLKPSPAPVAPEEQQALRTTVKNLELQAEQLQQNMLEQLASGAKSDNPGPAAMEHNVRLYLKTLTSTWDTRDGTPC